jgi:hypothetical protein
MNYATKKLYNIGRWWGHRNKGKGVGGLGGGVEGRGGRMGGLQVGQILWPYQVKILALSRSLRFQQKYCWNFLSGNYIYIYICVCVCVCVYVYICVYICMYLFMYACMHVGGLYNVLMCLCDGKNIGYTRLYKNVIFNGERETETDRQTDRKAQTDRHTHTHMNVCVCVLRVCCVCVVLLCHYYGKTFGKWDFMYKSVLQLTNTHTHIYIYIYIYMYMFVCVCVCVRARVCVCIVLSCLYYGKKPLLNETLCTKMCYN